MASARCASIMSAHRGTVSSANRRELTTTSSQHIAGDLRSTLKETVEDYEEDDVPDLQEEKSVYQLFRERVYDPIMDLLLDEQTHHVQAELSKEEDAEWEAVWQDAKSYYWAKPPSEPPIEVWYRAMDNAIKYD